MTGNSGGVGKLLAVSVLLIIAVGALAVLNMDLFGLKARLLGDAEDDHSRIPVPPPPKPPAGNGQTPDPVPRFVATAPDDRDWLTPRERPLPAQLTISRQVGAYKAELDLVLIPGGSFPMGEDDGVHSNEPKRWVKCDDFYIARTEMTNEQYFAFILDNGYTRSQFWSQAGYEFVRGNDMAGTELIGWSALDENKQIWALSAPQGDVTIELRGRDGSPGRAGAPVLILPVGGSWGDFFQYDAVSRQARIKGHNGQWQDCNGDEVSRFQRLKDDALYYSTDATGRIRLDTLPANRRYLVVTWPTSSMDQPTSGNLSRGEAMRLRGPKMPVVSLTWFEADACARWWGGQLPYESWWEKAARGTDGRLFPWGNDLDLTVQLHPGGPKTSPYANFNRGEVLEVGSFPSGASPYGLLDMVGNVGEWVFDTYTAQPLREPRFGGINPHVVGGPRETRCERGSSTKDDDPQTAKLHNRRRGDPFGFNRYRGMRIAFTADAALKAAGR